MKGSRDASYFASQQLAAAALEAGAEAIVVPSATGIEANLIVFPDHLAEGSRINVVKQIADLRPILAALSGPA